jgi:glycosyltransferase involved in cell wall biosynthesis
MRIGIDMRSLVSLTDQAGIFQYMVNLMVNLARIDTKNDYTLFFNFAKRVHLRHVQPVLSLGANFRVKVCRLPGRVMHRLIGTKAFPIELFLGRVDVFHGPVLALPAQLFGRSVVTVHDLMFVKHPEFLKPEWVSDLRQKASFSLARADAIIADSNFTKQDLIDAYHIPEGKIKVIYCGVGREFCPLADPRQIEAVKRKYAIQGKYLLFAGNIEPKKNLTRLVEAFSLLNHRSSHRYKLVVVGNKGWDFERVFAVVRQLRIESQVVFTDAIPREDLVAVYNGAEVFVFPSLFEGFGIPVIEAMACGVPVVASNITALLEVIGDAGILVDPLYPEVIATAIEAVLSDAALRQELCRRGFARAKQLTWERTARETLILYKEIA